MVDITRPSCRAWRHNVGIALFNRTGQVFVGKTFSDGPEYVLPGLEWQMPQGGIDANEDIIVAARRELAEETGVSKAAVLMASDEWWRYDFPPPDRAPAVTIPARAIAGHRLSVFRGQQQRWVAFRFEGRDGDIDLGTSGADFYPEFTAWRWTSLAAAVAGVMPFKRETYRKVALMFARFEQGAA
jgi:putative (di)nucleoside polyphosphate hydrolase